MTEQELKLRGDIAQIINAAMLLQHESTRMGGVVESPFPYVDQILTIFKEADLVQLADDQTLPITAPDNMIIADYNQGQLDLLQASWRKVILPEPK